MFHIVTQYPLLIPQFKPIFHLFIGRLSICFSILSSVYSACLPGSTCFCVPPPPSFDLPFCLILTCCVWIFFGFSTFAFRFRFCLFAELGCLIVFRPLTCWPFFGLPLIQMFAGIPTLDIWLHTRLYWLLWTDPDRTWPVLTLPKKEKFPLDYFGVCDWFRGSAAWQEFIQPYVITHFYLKLLHLLTIPPVLIENSSIQ